MKMVLKELLETRINLRIIDEKPLTVDPKVKATLKECNELIGIFTASIMTAKKSKV